MRRFPLYWPKGRGESGRASLVGFSKIFVPAAGVTAPEGQARAEAVKWEARAPAGASSNPCVAAPGHLVLHGHRPGRIFPEIRCANAQWSRMRGRQMKTCRCSVTAFQRDCCNKVHLPVRLCL